MSSFQLPCPAGEFCVLGVEAQCPAGYYGAATESSEPECDGPCLAGYYCEPGSTSPSQYACGDPSLYCPSASGAPVPVSVGYYTSGAGSGTDDGTTRTSQLQCVPGTYCVAGEQANCAATLYGSTYELTASSCTGVCATGYLCPAASVLATAVDCPRGFYCTAGVARACPPGTYQAAVRQVSADACKLCPENTYSTRANSTSQTLCRACVVPEGSPAGAVSCWPGLLSATASNPSPIAPGISSGDILTLTFTKATNKPAVGTDADIANLILLSSPIGVNNVGTWMAGGTVLVVTIGTPQLANGGNLDPFATRIGVLTVGVRGSGGLLDAARVSAATPFAPVLVNGTFGIAVMPAFLPPGGTRAGTFARNSGGAIGPSVGDTLELRFQTPCKLVPVATTADIDNLITFSERIGANYTGVWLATGPLSNTMVTITITRTYIPLPGTEDDWVRDVNIGALVITVNERAKMTSLDGTTAPSNASTVLAAGTWGEVPAAINLAVHSPSSARATISPPVLNARFTTSYVIQWSNSSSFATVLGTASVVVRAASGVYTVRGLVVAAACYMRAAAGLSIVFGSETYAHIGPWGYAAPVVPLGPSITSAVLQSAVSLSTSGGQTVVFSGTRLGLDADSNVTAVYSNGAYVHVTPPCVVTVPSTLVACTTVEGVGTGYAFSLSVNGGVSNTAPVLYDYQVPIVTNFRGDVNRSDTSASTAGGQYLTIVGRQFGPVGTRTDSALYSPVDSPGTVFAAVDCVVTLAHTEITCVVAPGGGARLSWTVTIAGQSSSLPSVSYEVPFVTRIGTAAGTSNLNTLGGDVIVISGGGFGRPGYDFVTPPAGGATVSSSTSRQSGGAMSNCHVTFSDVELHCTMPAGSGVGWTVLVQVLLQSSVAGSLIDPNLMLAYARPSLVCSALHPAIDTEGSLGVAMKAQYTAEGLTSAFLCALDDLGFCVGCGHVVVEPDDNPAISQVTFSTPALEGRLWNRTLAVIVEVDGQNSTYACPVDVTPPAASETPLSAVTYDQVQKQLLLGSLGMTLLQCYANAESFTRDDIMLLVPGTGFGGANDAHRATLLVYEPLTPEEDVVLTDNLPFVYKNISAAGCGMSHSQVVFIVSSKTILLGIANVSVDGSLLVGFNFPFLMSDLLNRAAQQVPLFLTGVDGQRQGAWAYNSGRQAGLGVGDVLELRFDSAVTPVRVATKVDIDKLLQFSASVGANYTGYWVTTGPQALTVLRVTMTAPPPPAVAVGAVGSLVITVLKGGGLKSNDSTSAASTDSTQLVAGTWGDLPAPVEWAVRSWTALRVWSGPPSTKFGYQVAQYFAVWGFAGIGSSRVTAARWVGSANLTISSPDGPLQFNATGLHAGTSVIISIAAFVDIVVGSESVHELGPAIVTTEDIQTALPFVAQLSITGASALNTRGGQQLVITGTNLGLESADVTVAYSNGRYGYSAAPCEVQGTPPGTQLACSTSVGVGANHRVVVSVMGGSSNQSAATISYDRPVVTSFAGPCFAGKGGVTAGGDACVVSGRNFGPAELGYLDSVSYSPADTPLVFFPTGCAVSTAHVEITCETVPGAGARASWQVVVGNQSSLSPSTTYTPPVLLNVTRTEKKSLVTLLKTSGDDVLKLVGINFGTDILYVSPPMGGVTMVPPDGSAPIPLSGCKFESSAATGTLLCYTPPGIGTGYRVVVTSLRQSSTPNPTILSYAAPSLTSVTLLPLGNLSRVGGATLTVIGANFGAVQSAIRLVACTSSALVACVTLPSTISTPHTALTATAPALTGIFAGLSKLYFAVYVLTRAANSKSVYVMLPTLVKVIAQNLVDFLAAPIGKLGNQVPCVAYAAAHNNTGGFLLSIYGTQFGTDTASTKVDIVPKGKSKSACAICAQLDTVINCISNVTSGTLKVQVGAYRTSYEYDSATSIMAPSIETITANDLSSAAIAATAGGTMLVIQGKNFNTGGTVYLFSWPATISAPTVAPKFAVICNDSVPGGFWGRVTEWLGQNASTTSELDMVRCLVPPGIGSNLGIMMYVRQFIVWSGLRSFSYAPPTLATLIPRNLPTTGGLLVLNGTNFGATPRSASVTVGSLACPLIYVTQTLAACMAPIGIGASVSVSITVANRTNDANGAPKLAYDAPQLTGIDPPIGLTQGGNVVVLSGSGFGAGQLGVPKVTFTLPARNGSSANAQVAGVQSFSDSVISVVVPPGDDDGLGLEVSVYNGAQNGLQVVAYSYLPPHVGFVSALGSRSIRGGFRVLVAGANFGAAPTVYIGGTTDIHVCNITSHNHSTVYCWAPAGYGVNNTVFLKTMRALWATWAQFQYDGPIMAGVTPPIVNAENRVALAISGFNFVEKNLEVLVGGLACVDTPHFFNSTTITCNAPFPVPVGPHNVTVSDGQRVSAPGYYIALCGPGKFGIYGESCAPCPSGARCAGGLAEPVATPGFFKMARTRFVECQPQEACVGGEGDPCALGYTGPVCSLCAKGFYRLSGYCPPCPSIAFLYVLAFVFGTIILVGTAVWLAKRKVNMVREELPILRGCPVRLFEAGVESGLVELLSGWLCAHIRVLVHVS